MLNVDLAIMGAGPAGSLAAWEAMKNNSNAQISVFEEHFQVGHPPHCSGLFSLGGFQKLGLNLHEVGQKLGYNKIRRVKFIGPNFNFFEIDRGKDSMGVFDRVALDCYLARRAREVGCEYRLGHRIKKIQFNGNIWNLYISHKKEKMIYQSNLLISAEGVHARLTSSIGLPTPNKNWLFPALQYEYEGIQDIETDCVELYFGRKYAPGFFGWFIPVNENSARLGIAVSRIFSGKTRIFMQKFLKKHPLICKRLKKSRITNTYGGFVPGAGPVKKTYHTNIMVAGDAAGQSKATTGGGVNIGGYCGRLAGLMASKIISEELTPTKGCREYQRRWQGQFEPELSIMKLFRRMMTPLTDDSWNEIVQIARDTDIEQRMKYTSIDLHGMSLLKYSLTPQVFIKGLHLVPHAVISLLRGLAF